MAGKKLAAILSRHMSDHLVLITTMRQLLEFVHNAPEWKLSFDFVLDGVAPKRSVSYLQPHYVHQTGAYFTRDGARSVFDRRRRQRSDVFEGNGYWPTIFHAPRDRMAEYGQAKNADAITDILGSFDVDSVLDPFAGTGTVGLAAFDLGISATLIERDRERFDRMKKKLKFVGCSFGSREIVE